MNPGACLTVPRYHKPNYHRQMKAAMQYLKALLVFCLALGCTDMTSTNDLDPCNDFCKAQRDQIRQASQPIPLEAQSAILGGVFGAALGAIVSSDNNRRQAVLAGAVIGSGAGYAIGMNIRNNRSKALELANKTAVNLNAKSNEVRVAARAVANLQRLRISETTARQGQLRSGQISEADLVGGAKTDIRIANATRGILEGQLNSVIGLRRALSEERISSSQLDNSISRFETSLASYDRSVQDAQENLDLMLASQDGCSSLDQSSDDLSDDPLPRCQAN